MRELEERIRQPRSTPSSSSDSSRGTIKVKAPHVAEREEALSQSLGTKVEIREGQGRGRIIIEFYSTDDFERLQSLLLAGTQRR